MYSYFVWYHDAMTGGCFPHYRPLWGESTRRRCRPLTKDQWYWLLMFPLVSTWTNRRCSMTPWCVYDVIVIHCISVDVRGDASIDGARRRRRHRRSNWRSYHWCSKCKRGFQMSWTFYTVRPRQNGCKFADDISKRIFLNENVWI